MMVIIIIITITRFEDMASRWLIKANTILLSTLPLPMNSLLLPSGLQNEYDDDAHDYKFYQLLLRFGHSMVSGLFEPIGHKKWPLKFHFHDFQEFVLGGDGRAYQNELRVCFSSSKKTIAKKQKRINIQDLVFGYDRRGKPD